ncbi:MAG TPA: hypothetical protein VGK54_09420 [Chloroflexota bacterium]
MIPNQLNVTPNPRLQRTRLRSPLSRKPFGELRVIVCLLILLGVAPSIQSQRPLESDYYVFKGYNILPSSVPIPQEEILRMLVPSYQEKLRASEAKLADRSDPGASWHTYEAAVVSFRRTNLGIRGEDFLIVAIEEIDTPCRSCRFTTFGGIDLKRTSSMGSFRSADAALPDEKPITLVKSGKPWKVIFRYAFGSSNSSCGKEWQRGAVPNLNSSSGWELGFGAVTERFVGECK